MEKKPWFSRSWSNRQNHIPPSGSDFALCSEMQAVFHSVVEVPVSSELHDAVLLSCLLLASFVTSCRSNHESTTHWTHNCPRGHRDTLLHYSLPPQTHNDHWGGSLECSTTWENLPSRSHSPLCVRGHPCHSFVIGTWNCLWRNERHDFSTYNSLFLHPFSVTTSSLQAQPKAILIYRYSEKREEKIEWESIVD